MHWLLSVSTFVEGAEVARATIVANFHSVCSKFLLAADSMLTTDAVSGLVSSVSSHT